MPKLLVEKGPSKGNSLVLSEAAALFVGREPSCTLVLNDSNVSRRHCEVVFKSKAWRVKDLGSRNGTYVNGKRVDGEQALSVGDRIQVGELLLSFLDEKEGKNEGGLIGQRLAGYRVMERLGRGGMGTVYKANQIALNREIALKVLSADLIEEDLFKNLFIAEARAAAALNHPNIVQVHDVGCEGGTYYFSMEYLPNGSVLDLLTREGRITASRALRIAMDAASGLSYAEKKGIVHRDIKPENLMIAESGVVKIGDLGLAFDRQKGTMDDQVGMMGTPHYCSPEQVTKGKLDTRSDLYSLGATMYRMLAGRPPFTGSTLKEILVKKVKEKATPLSEAAPNLPPAVNDLVMQLLEKDPGKRPQSAEELRGRIEALLPEVEGLGVVAPGSRSTTVSRISPPQEAGPTSVTPARKADRSNPSLLYGGLAVACALLVFASWALYKVWSGKQEANDGRPIVKEPGVQGDGHRAPTLEEKANAALLEAATWVEQSADLKQRMGLQGAIARYDEIVNAYPGTSANLIAAGRAKELRHKLVALNAREALDQVIRSKEDATREFEAERKPGVYEPVLDAFRAIIANFQGTEAAEDARNEIQALEEKLASVKAAPDDWADSQKNAQNLAAQRNYAEAMRVLRDFIEKYDGTGWDATANTELATVEQASRENLVKVFDTDLAPLLTTRSWDAARRLLEATRTACGLADLEEKIDAELARIDVLSAKIETPPAPDEGKVAEEAQIAAEERMRSWAFSEAVALLMTALEKVNAADLREKLETLRSDAAAIAVFKSGLVSRANGIEGDSSGLSKNHEFRGSKITSATDAGLKLEKGGEIPWDALSATEVFALAFTAWKPNGREAMGVGVLCMRSAAYRCARFAFATARTREPDLSATCHLLSERSRRADRAHPPGDPAGLRLFNVELEEWRRAEAAADRIIPALGKEKNYRWQGEVYSSIQEFDTADKHFELALAEQKGLGSEEEWRIHWFMLMDAMMEGDDAAFREHAFRCNNIFPDGEHIPQVQLVSDMNRDLIQNLVRLDGLRATVLTRPDPKTAIALFETLERMHLGIEKRAVSRWLAEDAMFRKEKLVKSGDAQMALAYSCLDMKDYLEAKRMFEKLRKNFPSHPLCRTPENGSRKVDNLWNLCGDMVRKYNLALTSPR